ncbi:B3 DNA binding domain-containing protein [Artemisia annua]|uniref:B3 DNA binding domain-containing protein n=1 Tax=Artemisia annua TaxID=35608 RepID=A0A2U1LTP5_ARTAN|nr:B3 DNA binding domain-containing protein [Artemisia annua]
MSGALRTLGESAAKAAKNSTAQESTAKDTIAQDIHSVASGNAQDSAAQETVATDPAASEKVNSADAQGSTDGSNDKSAAEEKQELAQKTVRRLCFRPHHASLPSELPSFVKAMLPSHVAGGFWLGLTKQFCDADLPKHDETIVLVDEDGQEFNTKFLVGKIGLSGGWRGFSIAHKLLEGDVYIVRVHGLNEIDGALGLLNLIPSGMNVVNVCKLLYICPNVFTISYREGRSSHGSKLARTEVGHY